MRSGTRSYNAREDEFIQNVYKKTLNDMSYSELRAYQYKLWLSAVESYGSEAKLREAYKKKGIKLTKPPPPVQIAGGAGGGGIGPPGLPPIIVPIQTANVNPTQEDRRIVEEQVIQLQRDISRRNNVEMPLLDLSPTSIEVSGTDSGPQSPPSTPPNPKHSPNPRYNGVFFGDAQGNR